MYFCFCFFFFFSSRRRHTRCSRDWSSDVCSSDLERPGEHREAAQEVLLFDVEQLVAPPQRGLQRSLPRQAPTGLVDEEPEAVLERSEERRVGKECRSRWSRCQ